MFRIKLIDWMRANPGVIPNHTIWVHPPAFGSKLSGEYITVSKGEVCIKHSGLGKLIGPLESSEIELPLSYIKEVETIRDNKIDDIMKP